MQRISILLPNRNTLPFLKLCLRSLRRNLRRTDNRILVLDGASSDGSAEWLAENQSRFGYDVEFYGEPERLGIVGAYNRLVEAAETDVVFLVHSDMYFALGADEETARHLAPATVCTCTRIEPPLYPATARTIVADLGFGPEDFREEKFLRLAADRAEPGRYTEGIFAPVMCFREDFLAVGGLDPAFAPQSQEDSDLFNRMAVAGYRFRQSWSAFCYHFSGRGSRKKDGTDTDSREWRQSKRKNERNFIRRWGAGVRTDEWLKPIVPSAEPLSLAVFADEESEQELISLLTHAEPYFDEVVVLCLGRRRHFERALASYVRQEQGAGPTLLDPGKLLVRKLPPGTDTEAWRAFAVENCGADWIMLAFPDERFDRNLLEHLRDLTHSMRGTGKTICGFACSAGPDRNRRGSGEPQFRLVKRGVRFRRERPDMPVAADGSSGETLVWPHGGIGGPQGTHPPGKPPLVLADRQLSRVAIDARTVEPRMHGIGLYAHRLVLQLARLAPYIQFIVLHGPDGRALFGGFPPNVEPVLCPVPLGDPRWERSVGERWCMDRGIDLYHGASYGCVGAGRIPSISTVHDVSFATFPEFYSDEFSRHMASELNHTIRCADHIITVSAHVRDVLGEAFAIEAGRMTAVHSGPGQFDQPIATSGPREHVLALDLGQRRKNADGVLEGFALALKRAELPGKLKFVERAWHIRPELRARCEQLGILDRVEVTGAVGTEKLQALYSTALCLLYPSFDEGFGFPPLEAMQCGTPVVASSAGSLPEVCGDAALYVNPKEPEMIAQALERIVGDESLAAELSERGRQRVRQFSWGDCAAETLSVYRQTAAAGRRRVAKSTGEAPPPAGGSERQVGMVSTWNVPCGVAECTRRLVENLRPDWRVVVLSELRDAPADPEEHPCWQRPSELEGIAHEASARQCGVVHIQYHPAFFCDGDTFSDLLWQLKLRGLGTAVTLHELSGTPPVWCLIPDLLIAHSEGMRELLARSGFTTPCVVIPLALTDGGSWPHRPQEGGKIVLKTVGFLHPNRGHKRGLETLAVLRDRLDVEYHVAGAPARGQECYPRELRNYARELGVADRFKLTTGYIPREELLDEWAAATVGLLPYGYAGVGSSGAVLDALSAGTPVVTSRSSFFDELGGAVLQTSDPDEIADAVIRLTQNEKVLRRAGVARDSLLADRSPRLRAERHERAYEQVLVRTRRMRCQELTPWVSVHIIARERSRLGLELYRSTLGSLKGYADEFVVVDNGSSEQVAQMVNRELTGENVTLISAAEVKDFATLRNIALDHTSEQATHVHWVDTDQVFFPRQLARLKRALRDPDISIMHVLLVHFMIEPTRVQDTQVNRCVFRFTDQMHWRKAVHEVVEGTAAGRDSFIPVKFLHFGYVRPQWQTCLKWLQYEFLENGSLDRYKWQDPKEERRPWFGERKTPNTILNERTTTLYTGHYPPSCAPWLEPWRRSGLPWAEYLTRLVDHTPWHTWRELRKRRGSWEDTLEEMLALTEGIRPGASG